MGSLRITAGLFALRIALVVFEFVVGLIMARMLGGAGFGAFALVNATLAWLGPSSALGTDRLLLRDIATMREVAVAAEIAGRYRSARRAVMIFSSVIATAVASMALVLHETFGLDISLILAGGACGLPFLAVGKVRQALLQAFQRPACGLLPEAVGQPMLLLLSLLVLAALGVRLEASGAVALYVGSIAVATMTGGLTARGYLANLPETHHRQAAATWLMRGGPFLWIIIATMAMAHLPTVITGLVEDPTAAGQLRIATQMAALVGFPLSTLSIMAAPAIAAAYSRRDVGAMRNVTRRTVRLSLAGAFAAAAGLAATGPVLLALFGPGFKAAYEPMMILVVAYLANTATGAAGYVLVMTEMEGRAARIFLTGAILQSVLVVFFVPRFGVLGAAVGAAVGIILTSVMLGITAQRFLARVSVGWSAAE